MIGETISHYRVLEKLGEGGMGVIYLAEDTTLGRKVAIKTIRGVYGQSDQHFRARFLREAQAVSRLSHSNIATIYDYGETPNRQPFIVMELVNGKTLSDLIRQQSLNVFETIQIVRQVAEALSEAHRHGIIHRDIKPSNIAVTERGNVKVLDFGLAKHIATEPVSKEAIDSSVPENTRTREGIILGTPIYLSPEQALGGEVDARSDLFSLGSVLYECIVGRAPFASNTDADVIAKLIRDDPVPPSRLNPSVPLELERITLKSLAKEREARYQTAEHLVEDLNAVSTSPSEPRRLLSPVKPSVFTVATRSPLAFVNILKRSRPSLIFVTIVSLLIAASAFAAWRYGAARHYQPSTEALRWYTQGIGALQEGAYYKASNLMEEAIKQDPNFALAYARRAEALAELGYFDKATAEISKANLLVSDASFSPIDQLYLRAINAKVSHNFQGAVESYRQMIPLVPTTEVSHLYVDLGRAYEKNDDLANAILSYKEAIKYDSQYAPAFLRMGIVHVRQQKLDEGESSLAKALELSHIQYNPEGMAEVMIQQGGLFVSKPDIKKARESLEGALQIIRTFRNPSQEIKALLQLSSVYRQSRDPKMAKQYATEALDAASANELSDLKTQAIIELGYVYFFASDIPNAERNFKEALEHARVDRVRVSEARAQFALGSMHIQQDEPDEGLPFIEAALPFFQQNVYRKEVMQSQTLIGQARALKGQLADALTAFDEALKLAETLNSQREIGLLHKSMATVLGEQERYPEALDHLNKSYTIFTNLGNDLYRGYTLIGRAEMEWRLGQYNEATGDLNLATALAEKPDGFKQLWGRIYSLKAPMALSQGKFRDAIRFAQQAAAADTSRTKHPAIEAQYTLGLAQFYSGDKTIGKKTCEQAVELASRTGYPKLVLGSLLALSEVLMDETPNDALSNAIKASELANESDQFESKWRALVIAGQASALLQDNPKARQSLLAADGARTSFRQRWGDAAFNSYLTRADVKRFDELLRAATVLSQ